MLEALRHASSLTRTAEVLADSLRYVAIMLLVAMLLRQVARLAL